MPCSTRSQPGSHDVGTRIPLVFFDALRVKIRDEGTVRNKAVHVALGVRGDGTNEILGLWIETNEGAKFWLRVMNELKNRGVDHILITVVDGLKGLPMPSTRPFRKRPCKLHRPSAPNLAEFCLLEGPEGSGQSTEADLFGRRWHGCRGHADLVRRGLLGPEYPAIGSMWRRAWQEVIPFVAFPRDVRRIVYTTNSIEALNSKLRRAVGARGIAVR